MPSPHRTTGTPLDLVSSALVRDLRATLRQLETTRGGQGGNIIHSGCTALDRLLPAGGFLRGSLIECLDSGPGTSDMLGSGVGTFALLLARQALFPGGTVVILDRHQQFYPPAAASLGLDLNNLLVIRAAQERDELWALDQALRCPAVAAVWAPLARLAPRDFRRLQLAAQSGECLGLLIRYGVARTQPSWSDIQFLVHPYSHRPQDFEIERHLRIELTRCRHGRRGSSIQLAIDDTTGRMRPVESSHETHTLHLASQLAYPTSDRCSTRA